MGSSVAKFPMGSIARYLKKGETSVIRMSESSSESWSRYLGKA